MPAENWLPINRKDEDTDMVLRACIANLDKMKTCQPPKEEELSP